MWLKVLTSLSIWMAKALKCTRIPWLCLTPVKSRLKLWSVLASLLFVWLQWRAGSSHEVCLHTLLSVWLQWRAGWSCEVCLPPFSLSDSSEEPAKAVKCTHIPFSLSDSSEKPAEALKCTCLPSLCLTPVKSRLKLWSVLASLLSAWLQWRAG